MGRQDDGDIVRDKQWAKKYLLDPLHEAEPSQECGPGSSFRHPDGIQRSLSVQAKPSSANGKNNSFGRSSDKPLPVPPTSTNPSQSRSRPALPPSHPTSPAGFTVSRRLPDEDTEEDVQKLHNFLVRSLSVNESRTDSSRQLRDLPQGARLNRSKTVHTPRPGETGWSLGSILPRRLSTRSTKNQGTNLGRKNSTASDWNQGTILVRTDSVSSAQHRPPTPGSFHSPRSPNSIVASPVSSPISSPIVSPMASPVARNMDAGKGKGLGRSGSLSARFPGDMSHRPLDTIKQEQRAAMRAPYLHNPHHKPPADTIDGLDQTGIVDAPYHHEGPYDATLASRNRKKLYSPLDAVKDSNEEAIKATPREYIQDSLTKHVPLQGTAIVPPGMADMSGRRMEYEEGANLHEPGSAGRAYGRYAGLVSSSTMTTPVPAPSANCSRPFQQQKPNKKSDQRYGDGDLKGQGEPSDTLEGEQRARLKQTVGENRGDTQVYEMQPSAGMNRRLSRKSQGANVRQRSISDVDEQAGQTSPLMDREGGSENAYSTNTDLRRRNTTGKKFTEGLKRRFGTLRGKKKVSDEYR